MIAAIAGWADRLSLRTILWAAGGAICAAIFADVLIVGHGVFAYPLDDSYIALALSESIRGGGYGINPGEFASPSSSIFYPFLLAPTAGTPLHLYTPLFLDLIGSAVSLALLARIADLAGLAATLLARLVMAGLILVILLWTNFFGIAFGGLEHPLHVAATLAILAGLIETVERGRAPWWIVAGIVLATLFRFEGIAASLAGIAGLLLLREWWKAVLAGLILAACLGVYAAAMTAVGLPLLPNSVVLKSGLASAVSRLDFAGMVAAVEQKLVELRTLPQARILAALTLGILFGTIVGAIVTWRRLGWRQLVVPLFLAAILAAHLAAGPYGWIDRYEVYILVTGLAGLSYVDRGFLRLAVAGLARPLRRPFYFAGSAAALAVLCGAVIHYGGHYFRTTLQTAAGAYNIYEQQGQMSRFVRDFYKAPVAVNDLGYVAWRNPHYVLDIVGLGSQEVRAIQNHASRDTMDDLVRRHDIGLAIVYDDPDAGRQPEWTPVAYLRLGTPRVTPYRSSVTFYRTAYGSADEIDAALGAFAKAVLPGEIFERWPECGATIALGDLLRNLPDGTTASAPGVQPYRCPLTVKLGERVTADAITAQVDAGDTTWFRLFDGEKQVTQLKAPAVPRPGLRTVALAFPPVAFDSIRVEAGYDDSYAIGRIDIHHPGAAALP